MTNLLNFIDLNDLNTKDNPFDYINLHTRDYRKAYSFCKKFFANYELDYFYTKTSNFNYYDGYCYKLTKDKSGIIFLVKQNEKPYEA